MTAMTWQAQSLQKRQHVHWDLGITYLKVPTSPKRYIGNPSGVRERVEAFISVHGGTFMLRVVGNNLQWLSKSVGPVCVVGRLRIYDEANGGDRNFATTVLEVQLADDFPSLDCEVVINSNSSVTQRKGLVKTVPIYGTKGSLDLYDLHVDGATMRGAKRRVPTKKAD